MSEREANQPFERSNSGDLAIFTAIRRASSLVSILAVDRSESFAGGMLGKICITAMSTQGTVSSRA